MAEPKKDQKEESKSEPAVSVPLSSIADLIDARVKSELARIMTAKSPDERMSEELARQRGQDQPPLHEELIACRSPITNATFIARVIKSRKLGAPWRVAELLDYERPDGWDKKKNDGGLVPDGDAMPMRGADGGPSKVYAMWVYNTFWLRDWTAIGNGQPLPNQWRASYAPEPGSVTLTPADLARLGINRQQLDEALAISAKAAE